MSISYVGVDLGSSKFHQVALNHRGAPTLNREFVTSEANLIKAFSDLRGEIHVHLEAGELAPWASEIIRPLVTRVVCSHPQTNAWIARDRDKCDRIDAYKLASLLRLNEFKEVHYPREPLRRDFKTLVQHYDELTQQQARWKTKLKARLRMQGVIVRGEELFSVRGRKAVLAQVKFQCGAHGHQTTLCCAGPEYCLPDRSADVDAARGPGSAGDQDATDGAGGGTDWRLSLQCLHPYAAAVQLDAQALEVLPAKCQPPEQQRETVAPAAPGPHGLWSSQGCVAQSFRGRAAPA
jgi:hypothetical protein